MPSRMCASLSCRCSASSRVTSEPISTSPPPEGYLVSACITMSAPSDSPAPPSSKPLKASPAPQVLSSALVTPRSRQTRSRPRRSGNSIVTEPGGSIQTSFVAGPIIAPSAAASIGS